MAATYHNIGLLYKSLRNFPIAIRYIDSSIVLMKEGDDKFYLKESYNTLSELYADFHQFENAYKTLQLYTVLNDTLLNAENKKQFAAMSTQYESEKKDNEIRLLNRERIFQRFTRNGLGVSFAVVLVFAAIFFFQRNRIKKGKQRSDELLLNILPSETAEELKMTGEAVARYFDTVTVMFTDFKNFTSVSEKMSATELVREIHYYYSEFDKIIARYGLEKIKTISDSYMCAGGLPVASRTHAVDVLHAAIEIREFVLQQQKQNDTARPGFEIRIGCNTGPVVAGIVGIKKFAYDIWGDTVNIAARMEQNAVPGKINISGSTYALVKDYFHCIYRGRIAAKNKGEIEMYFCEGPLLQAEQV